MKGRWQNWCHAVYTSEKDFELLQDEIQKQIDEWHLSKKGSDFEKKAYINFLNSIGYIAKNQGDFKIETTNVDEEISSIAGPQLVVPVDNARYALNAANARWGSLYDALYGTDVIPGDKGENFNEDRAKKVITATGSLERPLIFNNNDRPGI